GAFSYARPPDQPGAAAGAAGAVPEGRFAGAVAPGERGGRAVLFDPAAADDSARQRGTLWAPHAALSGGRAGGAAVLLRHGEAVAAAVRAGRAGAGHGVVPGLRRAAHERGVPRGGAPARA